MADDDSETEGEGEIAKLEKTIKTTRTFFFAVLVASVVTTSILITSVVVINFQLSSRNEIPAEAFDKQLTMLASQLEHIATLHNSEAKIYFEFQDTLTQINALYSQDEIIALKNMLIQREQDHRKLLDLMAESNTSLASMLPGDRDWTKAYAQKIEAAKKLSLAHEKVIRDSTREKPTTESKDGKSREKKS